MKAYCKKVRNEYEEGYYQLGREAGIREVLDMARTNKNIYDEYWGYLCIDPDELQEFLKERGIKC